MELLTCKNVFKTAIWGGNNLSKLFNVESPHEKTSEIWTVSAHHNGETEMKSSNGNMCGGLSEIYKTEKDAFGISSKDYEEFPLLAKFIDANDKLSVQVHPDDNYARKKHNSFGKTEAWYIISAKSDAKIVYGLKEGTTAESLKQAISENNIEDVLNYVPAKTGDIFYIPAGMVHALLDGVIVYEMQQSSDITYRLYDWNRVGKDGKPRELHLEDALNVINPEEKGKIVRGELNSKFFTMKEITVTKEFELKDENSFIICSVIEGSITAENNTKVNAGESMIIPANYKTKINGEAKIIKTTLTQNK